MTMMNKNYASGQRVFSRSSCTEPMDPADDADAGRERASSPHGPLRRGASGVTERTRRGLPIGFAVAGGGGGASLGCRTRFPRRAGGRCAANANAPCASRRLTPEKCGGVDAVAGPSSVPGQSKWTRRPWATTGCATPGGGVVMKSRRPPGELRFMAAPARDAVMMAAAASARDLAAARPGDGRVYLGGRVAVLAGAARRGAALFGSLLIAAVPSSHRELMTMSTGAQTKHRAARASALNEMWVEVNRSLGAARDRVARAVPVQCLTTWIDDCRACGSHVNMDATQLVA